MDIKYAKAKAKYYQSQDKRITRELAIIEAILEQVIIDLDNKGKIPQSKLVDSS